jgi:glycogen debranching enzyme
VWRAAEDELFLFDDFSETPRVRGHASFREHPVFEGLYGGVYTWWPAEGERFCTISYEAPVWPETAQVVAVERGYIHINPARATIWEYRRPHGRIALCIGAYLPFAAADDILRPCLERLVHNALKYCGNAEDGGQRKYWPRPGGLITRHDPALVLPSTPVAADVIEGGTGLLALSSRPERAAAVTLAGRRAFAAGNEVDGITEVWTHPIRIISNLKLSIDTTAAASVEVRVTPLFLERTLAHELVERALVAQDLAVIAWSWNAQRACTLVAEWQVDLRFMWPYPPGVLGALRWNKDARSLLVVADDARDVARFVVSKPVHWEVLPYTDGDASILVRLTVSLVPGDVFNLVALGAEAANETKIEVRRWSRGNAGAWDKRARQLLRVSATDPRLDIALQWASHRLDRSVVAVTGVGRSLVAGYAASTPGWADGRPGYAWFFGRDAVWTAFALLALGDFEAVRDVLAFLGDKQDPRGKVLHECTTSGSVHYDAADSTPLYLLLMSRYLAASGDLHFVRSRWTQVLSALEYCRSTDRDGDGLIENTRVGHGWIEFGRLGGGKVTFYNAGIWVAALRELSISAETIGERATAGHLQAEAVRARQALKEQFFDAASGLFVLKLSDTANTAGREVALTQTATHAVPLLLGSVPPAAMNKWLDLVAGDDFTAPWGVRMMSAREPDYNPASYHGGAVWPLYTGWAAWAEYRAGRTTSALRHWWQNVLLCFEREKGAWDEVLHGSELRSIGVCPDQAWSAAMVVAPLVYGLLGFEPDAAKQRALLMPSLPDEWDRLDVDNLRVGDCTVSLHYERAGTVHRFRLLQTAGSVPLRIVFEPRVPQRVTDVLVDGVRAALDLEQFGERTRCPVQVVLDHDREIAIETSGSM